MQKKKVSKDLQCQIREYLDYIWRENTDDVEAEEQIVNQLSDVLRDKLLIESNKIVLIDSPIFSKNFSEQIISKTVPLIKEYKCTPGEIIFLEDDHDDCSIYFIEKGSAEIFLNNASQQSVVSFRHQQKEQQNQQLRQQQQQKGQGSKQNSNGTPGFHGGRGSGSHHQNTLFQQQYNQFNQQQLAVLKQGDVFGEVSFFTGFQRRNNVRSLEFTTLLQIKRQDFLELLQLYQDDLEVFCYLKDKLQFYQDFNVINQLCNSCRTSNHMMNQCPFIHYMPRKEFIIMRQNYNIEQGRFRQSRKLITKGKQYRTLLRNNETIKLLDQFQIDNFEILDNYELKFQLEDYDEEGEEQEQTQTDQPSIDYKLHKKSEDGGNNYQVLGGGQSSGGGSINNNQIIVRSYSNDSQKNLQNILDGVNLQQQSQQPLQQQQPFPSVSDNESFSSYLGFNLQKQVNEEQQKTEQQLFHIVEKDSMKEASSSSPLSSSSSSSSSSKQSSSKNSISNISQSVNEHRGSKDKSVLSQKNQEKKLNLKKSSTVLSNQSKDSESSHSRKNKREPRRSSTLETPLTYKNRKAPLHPTQPAQGHFNIQSTLHQIKKQHQQMPKIVIIGPLEEEEQQQKQEQNGSSSNNNQINRQGSQSPMTPEITPTDSDQTRKVDISSFSANLDDFQQGVNNYQQKENRITINTKKDSKTNSGGVGGTQNSPLRRSSIRSAASLLFQKNQLNPNVQPQYNFLQSSQGINGLPLTLQYYQRQSNSPKYSNNKYKQQMLLQQDLQQQQQQANTQQLFGNSPTKLKGQNTLVQNSMRRRMSIRQTLIDKPHKNIEEQTRIMALLQFMQQQQQQQQQNQQQHQHQQVQMNQGTGQLLSVNNNNKNVKRSSFMSTTSVDSVKRPQLLKKFSLKEDNQLLMDQHRQSLLAFPNFNRNDMDPYFGFDVLKSYIVYFPHNNVENIINNSHKKGIKKRNLTKLSPSRRKNLRNTRKLSSPGTSARKHSQLTTVKGLQKFCEKRKSSDISNKLQDLGPGNQQQGISQQTNQSNQQVRASIQYLHNNVEDEQQNIRTSYSHQISQSKVEEGESKKLYPDQQQ